MPKAKLLSKSMILAAMNKTASNKAAARYLNVDYHTYRKYSKMYMDVETGVTLFEKHKNQCGKGIPKFLSKYRYGVYGKDTPPLIDILEGRLDASSFNPTKIKNLMIAEGYLKEECYSCGYCIRREADYKMPLLFHFVNGKVQYGLQNCQLLCYNCYFIQFGTIFTNKDLQKLEDHASVFKTSEHSNFELDEYTKKRLEDISSKSITVSDDANDLISYKK